VSRIDDMIAALAPKGVKAELLGDIAALVRGNGMPKTDLTDEGVGAIHYGQIYTHYGAWTTDTISFVTPESAVKLAKVEPGDIVITNTSENLEDVGKAVAWLGEVPVVTGGHATVIKHDQEPKYLAYWFQSDSFLAQKKALATGTKVIDVSARQLAKVRIPVPPIEVQREIAQILDQFTELDELLSVELDTRRQQRREFARRLVDTSREGYQRSRNVELVRLGAVATQFVEPIRVEPDRPYTNLGVKWYGGGAFAREAKLGRAIKGSTLYRVKPGQMIFNRMFVTEGSFAVVPWDLADGVVSSEFPTYDLDESRVRAEWLLLYLLDDFSLRRIEREVTGTERGSMKSRRRWKEQQFNAFEIYLPPLKVQDEVLRINGALADLEASLRAEQIARRQQYGYYRDKLLTFDEAAG
jgi:type I restriction enzyme S subunit